MPTTLVAEVLTTRDDYRQGVYVILTKEYVIADMKIRDVLS